MGTKYSTNAASGYNATPPADDGTVSEANKVKYSTVKTKLADPVKDLADTINTELVTHFDRGPTALTTNTTLDATHYNQFIQASGSGVTLTLTDASTLTAGWFTDITSTDTSNNITLARATAANTIDAVSSDVTIRPLETLRIYVNAAATGFLTHVPSVPVRSGSVNEYKGADIASAGTTDIGAATGNFVDVTGTATITSFGTVQAGARRKVRFTGASSITYNATSMITISRSSQTNANGDVDEWVSLGSGNWVQTSRAQVNEGSQGLVKLNSGTVTNAASLAIVMTSYTGYPNKLLVMNSVRPQTDGTTLNMVISSDGGSSYDTAGNYRHASTSVSENGGTASTTITSSSSDTKWDFNINVIGNDTTEGAHLLLNLMGTTTGTVFPMALWEFVHINTGGEVVRTQGSGRHITAQDVDAIRIQFNSGNIVTANWVLYGYT